MKQIRIDKYIKPRTDAVLTVQKKYTVCLGNKYIIHFESNRDALRFLAETNRMLNNAVDMILYESGECYRLYASTWKYLKQPDTVKIQNELQNFNRIMHLAVDRSNWANGNYFVFQHLYNCINIHREILEILANKIKPGDSSARLITSGLARLQAIEFELKNWPDQPFMAVLSNQTKSKSTIRPPKP